MIRKSKGYRMDTFFSLASFCVFAASMLVVLLFGAGIYKNIVEKSQHGYNERISLSYIWTQIKTNDAAGQVSVGEFCGLPALCIKEEYEGSTYMTSIYLYDGWIRELFCEAGLEVYPEDGMPVIEADSLDFEQLGDGLIRARVNSQEQLISHLRAVPSDIEG